MQWYQDEGTWNPPHLPTGCHSGWNVRWHDPSFTTDQAYHLRGGSTLYPGAYSVPSPSMLCHDC